MKSAIILDPVDVEDPKNVEHDTNDYYTAEPVYSGRLVMADTFSWHPLNHGQTLIEKLLHCGHFYNRQLL